LFRLVVARIRGDLRAEDLDHTRAPDARAEDEHRQHGDRRRAREPRESLGSRADVATGLGEDVDRLGEQPPRRQLLGDRLDEQQRDQNSQRGDVDRDDLGDEQRQRCEDDREDDEDACRESEQCH